jgi:tetratricopeptide (TPR) repeat protein
MMFQGKIEAGIPHLRRAVAINPSDPISNLNIGFYEYQHGNLQQAIERYETVINLSSRSSEALRIQAFNNLGLVYQDVGDNLRAEQCFKAAINLSALYQ